MGGRHVNLTFLVTGIFLFWDRYLKTVWSFRVFLLWFIRWAWNSSQGAPPPPQALWILGFPSVPGSEEAGCYPPALLGGSSWPLALGNFLC